MKKKTIKTSFAKMMETCDRYGARHIHIYYCQNNRAMYASAASEMDGIKYSIKTTPARINFALDFAEDAENFGYIVDRPKIEKIMTRNSVQDIIKNS